jgi:4'-phosphopantetheinyl transferase EntD
MSAALPHASDLFPSGVVLVRATDAMADEPLDPAEEAGRMGARRRREYALGRACARRALAQLGIEGFALRNDGDRVPIWPDGVIGSLTHCRGYCAVAAARTGTVVGLGIDAEPCEPLSPRLVERICTSAERERNARLEEPVCGWGKLVFCAKESFYKSYFPLARRVLGFRDAEIVFEPEAGRFEAHLLREDAPAARGARILHGRYRIDAHHVVAAVTLTAEECDAAGRP